MSGLLRQATPNSALCPGREMCSPARSVGILAGSCFQEQSPPVLALGLVNRCRAVRDVGAAINQAKVSHCLDVVAVCRFLQQFNTLGRIGFFPGMPIRIT